MYGQQNIKKKNIDSIAMLTNQLLAATKTFLKKLVLICHFVDISASFMEPEVSLSSSPDHIYVSKITSLRH